MKCPDCGASLDSGAHSCNACKRVFTDEEQKYLKEEEEKRKKQEEEDRKSLEEEARRNANDSSPSGGSGGGGGGGRGQGHTDNNDILNSHDANKRYPTLNYAGTEINWENAGAAIVNIKRTMDSFETSGSALNKVDFSKVPNVKDDDMKGRAKCLSVTFGINDSDCILNSLLDNLKRTLDLASGQTFNSGDGLGYSDKLLKGYETLVSNHENLENDPTNFGNVHKDAASAAYYAALLAMGGDIDLKDLGDGKKSCSITGANGESYDVILDNGNIVKVLDKQGNEFFYDKNSNPTGFSYSMDDEHMNFEDPSSVYYRPGSNDVKVYNMDDAQVNDYLASIDNAINGNSASEEATVFYRCVNNVDGTEIYTTLVAYGKDDADYLLSNTDKYYDRFSELPTKAVSAVAESGQPITICSDFDCINADYESICGYNIKTSSGSGNAVFFKDIEGLHFDTFNYSFVHEMGHTFDAALGHYSSEESNRQELNDLFSKYNEHTEYIIHRYSEESANDYYYFKENSNGTVELNSEFIDEQGEFREHEAFAEAFRYYNMNPDDMKILAPDMYNYMDKVLNS